MRQKTEQTVKIKLMGWHQHIARNYYYTFIKVSVPLSATSGAKNMWRVYIHPGAKTLHIYFASPIGSCIRNETQGAHRSPHTKKRAK
jgi:effector-binding domain-containing protein